MIAWPKEEVTKSFQKQQGRWLMVSFFYFCWLKVDGRVDGYFK